MNLLSDGLVALVSYFDVIIVFFITILGTGLLVNYTRHDVRGAIRYDLLILYGLVSVTLLLLIATVSNISISRLRIFGITLFVISSGSMFYTLIVNFSTLKKHSLFLCLIGVSGFLIIILRLAWLQKAIYPSYSDSMIHYQVILDFFEYPVKVNSLYSLHSITSNYYHFGFHLLVIWIVNLFSLPIETGILIVGQLVLVVLSLNTFFFLLATTRNRLLSLIGVIIVSFAWQLPSFSVNWGKYPALLAIAITPAVFLFLIGNIHQRKAVSQYMLIGFVFLGVTLFHTRMLIIIITILVSCLLSNLVIDNFSGKIARMVGVIIFFMVTILLVTNKSTNLNYFSRQNMFPSILLVFFPFAFIYYTRISINISVMTLMMILITRIPIDLIFKNPAITFIDSTFLTMSIAFPLGTVMALGLYGFIDRVLVNHRKVLVYWGLLALIVISVDHYNTFNPHPCCNYLDKDRLASITWINKNTSKDSIFLISSISMEDHLMGVDAGVWINPLTNRETLKIDLNTNWYSDYGHLKFCEYDDHYIYLGGMADSFTRGNFQNPAWYQEVYDQGSVQIYRIVGCKK